MFWEEQHDKNPKSYVWDMVDITYVEGNSPHIHKFLECECKINSIIEGKQGPTLLLVLTQAYSF